MGFLYPGNQGSVDERHSRKNHAWWTTAREEFYQTGTCMSSAQEIPDFMHKPYKAIALVCAVPCIENKNSILNSGNFEGACYTEGLLHANCLKMLDLLFSIFLMLLHAKDLDISDGTALCFQHGEEYCTHKHKKPFLVGGQQRHHCGT